MAEMLKHALEGLGATVQMLNVAPGAPQIVYATQATYSDRNPVLYRLTPGTGPVWPVAVAHGTPLISMGSSYPGAKLHAPNENIRLDDYFGGIRVLGRFIAAFGAA
ncbi:MAG: hypothetical protein R3264_13705 [Anaerolineae bacterium]|nr:hypothetical protein [Anaerolineae bacterium]